MDRTAGNEKVRFGGSEEITDMGETEVIERVHAAERELKPLLNFIHAGKIEPKNGCVSYTYGAAVMRANDIREALTKLMVTGMQHAKERAEVSANQQDQT